MKILQILVLIFCLVVVANAQKAILTGSIYDPGGAVIVKSKVTAINQKGEKFEALSNEEGVYVLNLPLDKYKPILDQKITKYEIVVEGLGFEKFVLKNFKFVGATKGQMYLDFALDVGAMIDTISVPTKKKKRKTSAKILVKAR
jgi:hypothetical protein